jgi:hypothetical protein
MCFRGNQNHTCSYFLLLLFQKKKTLTWADALESCQTTTGVSEVIHYNYFYSGLCVETFQLFWKVPICRYQHSIRDIKCISFFSIAFQYMILFIKLREGALHPWLIGHGHWRWTTSLSPLCVQIQPGTFDSFIWGCYPASLASLVLLWCLCVWNNARRGTLGLHPLVKLESHHMTFAVLVWCKT